MGQVDAETALDLGREQFEHAPGAGAEVEERAERTFGERRLDGGFDLLVRDVQIADAVPFAGMAAEIVLRRLGVGGPQRLQPLAVAGERRIAWIEARHQVAHLRPAAAVLVEPEKRPCALAEPLDEPGIQEQPKMPGNAWLRLPQDLAKVGDAQLAVGEERQNAQPRPLSGGLERAADRLEREIVSQ